MIYLRHPKHGTKVATMEEEALFDESNGWTRFDPTLKSDVYTDTMSANTLRRRKAPNEKDVIHANRAGHHL